MSPYEINPYAVEGPALIAFSGGRTSAFMLWSIIEAHGGRLPDDTHVVFADTGKERPETLRFVAECSSRWGVEIHRVERVGGFDRLLEDKERINETLPLPSPVNRYCTIELKKMPQWRFMVGRGYDEWTNVVGLRADEMRRVVKLRDKEESRPVYPDGGETWLVGKENAESIGHARCDYLLPMANAGATEEDVMDFWANQPFDLELGQIEGNCDLCFMKAGWKLVKLMERRPGDADWWMGWEERAGGVFAKHARTYKQNSIIADAARRQMHLPLFIDTTEEDLGECLCTD